MVRYKGISYIGVSLAPGCSWVNADKEMVEQVELGEAEDGDA